MDSFERFAVLSRCVTVASWRVCLQKIAEDLGYPHFAMVISPEAPFRIDSELTFIQTNYPSAWVKKYVDEDLASIDPVVSYCQTKSIALVWSHDIFSGRRQKNFYEEACGHGICSGVSLPIHGPNGEHGSVSFASDAKPDKAILAEMSRNAVKLSCLRDYIVDTSVPFMRPVTAPGEQAVALSPRELECLKWCASGKSTWDMARIMNCSESGINAHFSRIRHKLGTSTRRQAIVKAIRIGLINPW